MERLKRFSSEELAIVRELVIESAARSRPSVDAQAKQLSKISRVLIVFSVVTAAYSVYEVENRLEEAGRQGAMVAGGLAGSLAGLNWGFYVGQPRLFVRQSERLLGACLEQCSQRIYTTERLKRKKDRNFNELVEGCDDG